MSFIDDTHHTISILWLDNKTLTFEGTLESLYFIPSSRVPSFQFLASDPESLLQVGFINLTSKLEGGRTSS